MALPSRISSALNAVRRRIRLQRALDAGSLFAVVGLGVAAVAVTLFKTGTLTQSQLWPAVGVAIALPVVGILIGWLRRAPALLAAQLLDRAHGLKSRIANALEFSGSPETSDFMDAAIADAESHTAGLRPGAAMPLRWPRDLAVALALGVGVFGISMLEVPTRAAVVLPTSLEPLLLDPDSLDAFERSLDPVLSDLESSEEIRTAARDLNQILEDMVDRRLDRTEALRRIQELENRLAEGRPADAEAMNESLRELGQELERASLTEAASEALREADAERAADAMRELANSLQNEAPSQAELERLRQALERASQRDEERQEQELQEERERLESLLQRQREQENRSEREERLLRRRERELERLSRNQEQVAEQRRQLDRLRREMERAAENLNRTAQDRDQASEAMRQAAEELNRMAREQMTEEQREQLQRQMEQLREMIRRAQQQQQQGGQGPQQQGGGGQQQRLQRFTLQAGGQGAQLRMPGQQGQQGQGQGQQGQGQGQQGQGQGQQGQQGQGQGQQGQGQGQQGQQGQGQGQQGQGQGQQGQGQGQQGQGQGGQAGQGGQGQGQGQGGQQVLELSPNGQGGSAILEIPGMGGQGQGQGQGQGGGDPGGAGAGTGHDPQMLDDPTRLGGGHQNTRVEGEQGAGPSRSEVILGAADRGFVGEGYQEVFTDYEGHAEEVLERDEVPPGYRFYVRRYFQLIRPRDAGEPSSTPAAAPDQGNP